MLILLTFGCFLPLLLQPTTSLPTQFSLGPPALGSIHCPFRTNGPTFFFFFWGFWFYVLEMQRFICGVAELADFDY